MAPGDKVRICGGAYPGESGTLDWIDQVAGCVVTAAGRRIVCATVFIQLSDKNQNEGD